MNDQTSTIDAASPLKHAPLKHGPLTQGGALFPNTSVDPDNPLLRTDSYKISHPAMGLPGATRTSAYIEARRDWDGIDTVAFFGLQVELAKMAGQVVTAGRLAEAEPFLRAHGLHLYLEGWRRIVEVHGGRLPLRISALPEGTRAPIGVAQVRIENTDPTLWWLPSFFETRLLRAVWYPSTVASLSAHMRGEIERRMRITEGDGPGTLDGAAFKLHDFGARGASSGESAALGGCGHLLSFSGSDTIEALVLARNMYGAAMAGYSIPATEHSVVTAWGESGECAFMEKLLDDHPSGLVACVSDSYDLMRAIRDYWGGALRDKVLARDGVLVVRPDSGEPTEIVPAVIEALMDAFGYTATPTGYRLLPPQVRVIQGDGIDRFSTPKVMDTMIARGLAIGNIAFGMGGGLLQKPNRDDFSYAFKVSAIEVGGVWRDVWKDPKTAGGAKTSKKGRVAVAGDGFTGALRHARLDEIAAGDDQLTPVFENGEILRISTLDEIRARLWGR